MSRHLSVATVIDKNKVASEYAWVLLLDIQVVNEVGELVETLYLAKNSENVTWQGNLYQAAHFNVEMKLDAEQEPSMTVTAQDPSGFIRERMDTYGGGVGFNVVISIVNTGNLDQSPEVQEEFQITEASTEGFDVHFTLGVENLLTIRFPNRLQFRDQCPLLFKGSLCKYTGEAATCDYTYAGDNGCKSKNNSINFGGFRGLVTITGV